MQTIYFYKTEMGKIAMAMEENFLTNVFYECSFNLLKNGKFIERETEEMESIFIQIREYLRGERKIFDVQMVLRGTSFQKKVWGNLQKSLRRNAFL
jgi:methylated-DNA-[protein]-cysteine S-methyltransferase